MNYKNLSKIALLMLVADSLFATPVLLYKNYLNQSFDSSKNSIMAGATTATAKGYSAILSNPAGLSSNENITIYLRTTTTNREDADAKPIVETNLGDQASIGFLYDYFALELKPDDYITGGAAYGYESQYGLFSAGVSYLSDITDRDDSSNLGDDEYATGDYGTVGLMWQKSFIDENNFYAIYFGISKKMSGQHEGSGNERVIPISPEKLSFGLGLETNVFDTSVLFTLDSSEESWKSSPETLSSTAFGIKWLIGEKFAIGGGMNTQTYSGGKLDGIDTFGAGVEFGFSIFHFNIAGLSRTVNDENNDVYLTEESIHLDVAFVF